MSKLINKAIGQARDNCSQILNINGDALSDLMMFLECNQQILIDNNECEVDFSEAKLLLQTLTVSIENSEMAKRQCLDWLIAIEEETK